MLAENLKQFVMVVRKKACGCVVTVSEVRPTLMHDLIEHELDPELEVDLLPTAESRRIRFGCDHEEQP